MRWRPCFVVSAAIATACSSGLPWLRGDLVNHPAALVGNWVDVEKSSPRDSSIWILTADGDDGAIHIAHDDAGGVHVEHQHYGYWYVRATAGEGPSFCVTRRPGRDAPSCTAFVLTVDSTSTPPRRTIRLASYAGAHHSGERVLVAVR